MNFRSGDRVKVTYEGVVQGREIIIDGGLGECFIIKADNGSNQAVYCHTGEVLMELVAPANWPPQKGDLWDNGEGNPYFCYEWGGFTKMKAPTGEGYLPSEWHRKFPRAQLIRRNK